MYKGCDCLAIEGYQYQASMIGQPSCPIIIQNQSLAVNHNQLPRTVPCITPHEQARQMIGVQRTVAPELRPLLIDFAQLPQEVTTSSSPSI